MIDIRDKAVFADYFLICNGENERQLQALVSSIAEDAKQKADARPLGLEGDPSGGWVLVDFGDLIVHAFAPQTRDYYDLEDLWSEAHIVLRMQ